ncbi:MAG TPA: AraC family transcriptional regulator [Bryobacteraceae bacterium]|nr:AraC family transcriptional regulator [Bryobacteraceae bacterium]
MAKIAVELEHALARRALDGAAGQATARRIAQGHGWTVQDIVCTSGPQDRPFEEQHSGFSIAIVAAGSFQYRSSIGHELMTPGSLLLGNAGQCFECGHEHGVGDRCISFYYAPEYFDRLTADAGARGSSLGFRTLRLPPLRALSSLIARACAGLTMDDELDVPWEELSIQLAAHTIQIAGGFRSDPNDPPPSAVARVTRAVRAIERHPDATLTLGGLAQEAGLSPYHFLRTFERLTGLTPHQYVLRARLREAAIRLADTERRAKILDIALDSGFGDVSNFNRAFRAEFGVTPRVYRFEAGR